MGGGKEFNFDDLESQINYNGLKAAGNGLTQTTLAFEELAKTNPNVTFIHKYPGMEALPKMVICLLNSLFQGFVNTGKLVEIAAGVKGLLAVPATLARWCLIPVVNMFATSIEVAGERGM